MVAAGSAEVLAAMRRSAAVGPFFAVAVEGPDAASGPRWLPGAALLGPTAELAAAIEEVRRWASGTHPRVAASLFFMSYTGRLLSAAVAGVLLGGVLLDLRADRLWWRYLPGQGAQLRMVAPAGWRPAALGEGPVERPGVRSVLLAALGGELVGGQLTATVRAIRELIPVSGRVLWGNAASSVAGALGALAGSGAVPAGVCRQAGEVLLDTPYLRGTGTFLPPEGQRGLAFRRRSCCLYYRLPDAAGVCADCVLAGRDR